ncbi:MAG: helix-turn-helix domain-containing protein [Phycisphaerae bacterium]|nr:helix-turn-helix domain-containing protein [Phycisphaerae bacterium]
MDRWNGTRWATLLQRFRQRAGLTRTELARSLSVTISYISKLEAGQKPPPEPQRRNIAEVLELTDEEALGFHVQAELERTDPVAVRYLKRLLDAETSEGEREFLRDGGQRPRRKQASHLIPIINKVAAGYPQEFTDLDYPIGVADQYITVPDVSDANAFAFYVYGDSMEPDFAAGSLVIASPNSHAGDGDPCFVRFSPLSRVSGCTFKRVYFESDGRVRLVPINRKYPEQTYRPGEIDGLWPVVRYYTRVARRVVGA